MHDQRCAADAYEPRGTGGTNLQGDGIEPRPDGPAICDDFVCLLVDRLLRSIILEDDDEFLRIE